MTSRYRLLVPIGAAVALGVSAFLPANPLADPADNFGQPLLLLPPPVSTIWLVVAAVGLLAAVLALHTPARRTRTWVVGGAAAVAFLLLDQSLLMALGYLPAVVVLLVVGRFDLVAVLASPALALQALVMAGCVVLLLELWGRRPDGPRDPAADAHADADAELALATRRTRKWALVAIEAPLAYALSRVLMFFGVPGFTAPGFDGPILWAGLGLAGAACVGALLTWGLIAPWGSRFPGWVPGLGGRAVPVRLAVVPALAVSMMIMAASREMLLQYVVESSGAFAEMARLPLLVLPQLLWPVWSVALASAAVNYGRRRGLGARASGVAAGAPG